ncbi:hypothetical protein [Staphylococcus borealis]|uniref:hypothetical protein n=1 Tax=Staphylococcus borealis TaxID=2742203 RepID=UPI0015830859|nr:hypothetical protein [Staphylococcus borealis]NUI84230.1 hypothetical protein [Staphylococcus borealis]
MAEVKLSQESYDELLSDIKALRLQSDTYFEQWQKAKKKAEAWDKLKEYVLDRNEAFSDRKDCAQSPQQFEHFENLLTAFKVIKTKMNDLERGSDE